MKNSEWRPMIQDSENRWTLAKALQAVSSRILLAVNSKDGGLMIDLSKRIMHGILVAKRGEKYIRCGKRNKPIGVFQKSYSMTLMCLDGTIHRFTIPDGIVIKGRADILFSR